MNRVSYSSNDSESFIRFIEADLRSPETKELKMHILMAVRNLKPGVRD